LSAEAHRAGEHLRKEILHVRKDITGSAEIAAPALQARVSELIVDAALLVVG
jgi:hypothetical protein